MRREKKRLVSVGEGSKRTGSRPLLTMWSSWAAATERSISRPGRKGAASLMVTMTERWLRRLVTLNLASEGESTVGCGHRVHVERTAAGGDKCPWSMVPYQLARPISDPEVKDRSTGSVVGAGWGGDWW